MAKKKAPITRVFEEHRAANVYAKTNLGKPEIIPFASQVLVCGEQVLRPDTIAPSQWLDFWEKVARL